MLTTAHKVLIGSAIGLGLVFSAFSAHRENWGMFGGALALTAALGVYFRWFSAKARR